MNTYYIKWKWLLKDEEIEERTFFGFEDFASYLMHNNQVMNILEMRVNDKVIKYEDTL